MLHIATPIYRFDFLELIYNTLPKHDDITWHIAKSTHTTALKGSFLNDKRVKIYEVGCLDTDTVAKRNKIFDHIRDGYFYLLDDDTVFLLEVYSIYKEQCEAKFEGMMVGNQKYGNNSKLFPRLRANFLMAMEGSTDFPIYTIDTGMVISYHTVLRHIRWTSEKYYHNDCYFWSACYAYFGEEKVVLSDKFVSYYNFFGPKFRFKLRIGFIKIKIDAKNPILAFLLENIYNLIMMIRNKVKKQPSVFINHFPFDRK